MAPATGTYGSTPGCRSTRSTSCSHAELPEGDDWDTVGGLLLSLLGHVPAEGESAEATAAG